MYPSLSKLFSAQPVRNENVRNGIEQLLIISSILVRPGLAVSMLFGHVFLSKSYKIIQVVGIVSDIDSLHKCLKYVRPQFY